ncbi:MAG: quinone-dependent dihydroorotate dehydrogenase [Anaerolineales bacterium]
MYKFFRSLLFKLDPETAHHLTLQMMWIGGLQPISTILQMLYSAPEKPVKAFGLTFKNPVGLAAGYDKDGIAIRGLSTLGFGHIEVGTVTPRPQPGNPKPRIFRLVEDEAVINRMGFPGKGAQYVSDQLSVFSNRPRSTVLGLNLGKNKDTPLEEAASDYISLLQRFSSLADYLAINISSPNTVGLRRLQGREMLEELLGAICQERERIMLGRGGHPPVLVKLAPDLSDDELEDALGVILDSGMDGVIATNTTLAREGLRSSHREETGGLSGSPLRVQSEAMLEKIVRRVHGKIPIISVGGIMSPEDAKRRLDMGATLVQVYTGLIYRGPGLVKEILKAF